MPTPEPTTPQLTEDAVREIEARANAASKGPWNQSAFAAMYIVAAGSDYVTVASVGEYNPDGSTHLEFSDAVENLDFIAHARTDIPALIRDWKAMRARIETLTTEWCECGHARDKHQFFSDHDECYECDQASPDLCCEWRPAPRPNENAALREQLAAEHAAHMVTIDNLKDTLQQRDALQSHLAQVTSERDEQKRMALALSAQLAKELRA